MDGCRPSIAYVSRPREGKWPDEAIVSAIAKDAPAYFGPSQHASVLMLTNAASLNFHTLMYYGARLGLASTMDVGLVITLRQDSEARQGEIIDWMLGGGRYLIVKLNEPDTALTYRSNGIRQMLENGGLPYNKWATFDLPDGLKGVVYRQQRGNISVVDLSKPVHRGASVSSWEVDLFRPDVVKLKIWREGTNGFAVVGESSKQRGVTGRNVFRLDAPLTVVPREYLGLYTEAGNVRFLPSTGETALPVQFELETDVTSQPSSQSWQPSRPYSFRVSFGGPAPPRAAGSKTTFAGKPVPLTFVDFSKRIAASGKIAAWAVKADAPEEMRLKIWRKSGDTWTVVGESAGENPAIGFNRFAIDAPIAVGTGDYVGFYTNWHSAANGVGVPFPVATGCGASSGGSGYVGGDFWATASHLTPDPGTFQIHAFLEGR